MLNVWSQPMILSSIWSEKEMYFLKKKRSFFHFIAIETPTLKRYENFKKKHADKIELPLELFLLIDDTVTMPQILFHHYPYW